MFQNTFARFKAKIESVKTAVPLFEFIDHHQTLQIVFKAAVFAHACVERVLPGMAERRMTEIVRERNRFDERFIPAQIARDRTRNLRHYQAMREPGPEQISFIIDKNLRFVFQPSERSAMNTPDTVTLKFGARPRGWLRPLPAARLRRARRIRREMRLFKRGQIRQIRIFLYHGSEY